MNTSFSNVILLTLLLATGLGNHLQAQPSTVNFAEIDRYLQGQMAEADILGAALAIVKGDQILHSVWDIMLHTGGQGNYVSEWYPILCVGFDLFLAGFVVGMAVLQQDSNKPVKVN